jgi:hypothetical protein
MKVVYCANQETKQKVFDAVINWYLENELFSGEAIMQSDRGIEGAPELLSDIADDILQFEVEYDD